MSQENKNRDVIITFATGIAIILLLNKIFGRGEKEELDEKTIGSLEKIYKKIPPSYSDHVYNDFADTVANALLSGFRRERKSHL